MSNLTSHEVIILGGGISGLSTAWFLRQKGISFKLFEKQSETGGVIASEYIEGSVMDFGPNSLRDRNGQIRKIAKDLGISDDLIGISEAFKTRYIVRDGKLQSLSPNISSLISTKVLSASGKIRLLKEPFIEAGSGEDESIGEFLERRIGKEAVDYLADPIFSGIYAGDIYRMSKKSVLPKLAEFEQDYGSVSWGAIRSKKEKREVKPMVLSFKKGIQQLTDAITEKISDHITYDEVLSLKKSDSGFEVATEEATYHSLNVISCIPAYNLGRILEGFEPELSAELMNIDYAPMLSVQLTFNKAEIDFITEGFGFLVPRKERIRLLGAIWKSSIFPELTNKDQHQFTLMIGGAHDRGILTEPKEQVEQEGIREFCRLMQFDARPSVIRSRLWKKAIPQFEVGYEQQKAKLDRFEGGNPGLYFGGNYQWGVSVPDCIQGAEGLAEELAAGL
ncbi:protoporphyrinogen oxidase [Gracilimonas sp.]|uniref:protoporphyrinogen oxidase n=1 Tax=Gracilimonas sp. TaxID=1974203 RepID=UPI0032ECDC3A